MKRKPLPDIEEINRRFEYNKLTGELVWKSGPCKGRIAGTVSNHGYRIIWVLGERFVAHRVIWLLVTGEDPVDLEIDHINCDKLDNRFSNLRLATHSDNGQNTKKRRNNTSGVKGVSYHRATRRWRAYTSVNSREVHLGYFDCIQDARIAVENKRKELHKVFHRHE